MNTNYPGGWLAALVADALHHVKKCKHLADARLSFQDNGTNFSKRYRLQRADNSKLDVLKIVAWDPLDAWLTDGFAKVQTRFAAQAEPPASFPRHELPAVSLFVWDCKLQISHVAGPSVRIELLIISATWAAQDRIGQTWAGPLSRLDRQKDAEALSKAVVDLTSVLAKPKPSENKPTLDSSSGMAGTHGLATHSAPNESQEALATQAPFLYNAANGLPQAVGASGNLDGNVETGATEATDNSLKEKPLTQGMYSTETKDVPVSVQLSTLSQEGIARTEKRSIQHWTTDGQPQSFGHTYMHNNNFRFTKDFILGSGIPSDQQSLLKKSESWYHPEPGKRHVAGNIPIGALKEVKEFRDRQDRVRARLMSKKIPFESHGERAQGMSASAARTRVNTTPPRSAGSSTDGSPSSHISTPIPWSPSQRSLLPPDSSAVQKSPSILSEQPEFELGASKIAPSMIAKDVQELEDPDSDSDPLNGPHSPANKHDVCFPTSKHILVNNTQISGQHSRRGRLPLAADEMDVIPENQQGTAPPSNTSPYRGTNLQYICSDEELPRSKTSHKRPRHSISPSRPQSSHTYKSRKLNTDADDTQGRIVRRGFAKTLETQDRATSPELGTDDPDCSTPVLQKSNIPKRYDLEGKNEDISPKALNLFRKFLLTYSTYTGNRQHFVSRCLKIKDLYHKNWLGYTLWDDFVIQHQSSYKEHCSEQLELGEDPKTYEEYFQEDVERTHFCEILNPTSIDEVFGLAKSPQVPNTVEEVKNPSPNKLASAEKSAGAASRLSKRQSDKSRTTRVSNASAIMKGNTESSNSYSRQTSSLIVKHVESKMDSPKQSPGRNEMNIDKENIFGDHESTERSRRRSVATQELSSGSKNVQSDEMNHKGVQSRSIESIRNSPFRAFVSKYRKLETVKNAVETSKNNRQTLKSVNIPRWEF